MRRVPSVKALATITDQPDLVRKALTTPNLRVFLNAHCPKTVAWIDRCYHDPLTGHDSRAEVRMVAADELLRTFGVESIRGPRTWDRYWQDTEVVYCNTGDTYAPTLLYRSRTDNFSVGTWGDIAERHNTWR